MAARALLKHIAPFVFSAARKASPLIWLAQKAWTSRRAEPSSDGFLATLAAAMGVTLLANFSPFSFVLLFPSLLCAVKATWLLPEDVANPKPA